MNDGNVNDQLIGIPTPDGVKNIHPDALKSIRAEGFDWLKEETKAKTGFKELVEVQAEKTGIPKGILTKWLKAQYKAATKVQKELAAAFDALDTAAGDGIN